MDGTVDGSTFPGGLVIKRFLSSAIQIVDIE